MGSGQLDLFGELGDGDDRPTPVPAREATREELEARREARRLPIDQHALNVIGLSQARAELQAGRSARIRAEHVCRTCGSSVVAVRPNGQHLSAWCAGCDRFSHHVSRRYLGLSTRPVTHVRRRISARRRAQILARDNGRCVLCGRSAAEGVEITVEHLVSVKDSRSLEADEDLIWDDLNLAAMCDSCQLGLGEQSVPVVMYLALLMIRAQRARRDHNWPAANQPPQPPRHPDTSSTSSSTDSIDEPTS